MIYIETIKVNVEEAIQGSIEHIERKYHSLVRPDFTQYSAIYPFTTENLTGYIEKLKLFGKKVLTVTGSGDQALNLVLNGARQIDNYDVTDNTYFYAELKIAALKVLNYQEFLYFLCNDYQSLHNENDIMKYETYLLMKQYLSQESQQYWDGIYTYFANDGKKLRDSKLFLGKDKLSRTIRNNEYLQSEEKYNQTKKNLEQVKLTFYHLNVMELNRLYPNVYDVILCSNIYYYLSFDIYATMKPEEFFEYVKSYLTSILNKDGQIVFAYQYDHAIKNKKEKIRNLRNLFSQLKQRKWDYNENDFKWGNQIHFPSFNAPDTKLDTVYIFDKKDETKKRN